MTWRAERGSERTQNSPLRVALYSGIYLQHDAISDSLRHKVSIFDSLAASGAPVEITLFTHATDCADERIRVIPSVTGLLHTPEFWSADVHLYEFGIYYPLFDSVFLVPDDRPKIAVYHNITPLHLVDGAPARKAVERSLVQKHNLCHMDHVACDSEYNRLDLIEFGLPDERLSILHLPPRCVAAHARQTTTQNNSPAHYLFVGRFVRAKGVLDLVRAAADLRDLGMHDFRLTLIGNTRLSDPVVVGELRDLIQCRALHDVVDMVGEADDDELARLLIECDALVIPSYHEGYCVPVVEALSAGCHVIGYEAANLPYITAGLGRLVPSGDIAALTDTLLEFAEDRRRVRTGTAPAIWRTDRGPMSDIEWNRAVTQHLRAFTHGAYRQGLLRLLDQILSSRPDGGPNWLKERAA